MENPTCEYPDCTREAISASPFCGQHTNNRTFNRSLKDIKEKELSGIRCNEVEIRKLKMSGKDFFSPLITNTDFTGVTFADCLFQTAIFEHCVFTGCRFIRCRFEQMDMTDVTLHETIFGDTQFEGCRFSEINFADETLLNGCDLDG